MLRTALSALLITASIGQAFGFAGQQRTVMMQPPGWVNHSIYPAVDNDFANCRYWSTWGYQSPSSLYSITRASVKTNLLSTSASGAAYVTFGNNVLPITCGQGTGLLIEEARTNYAINSTAPATQTPSLTTGNYILWVNGSGSATMSSGTATGCGTGTASQGSTVLFNISVAGTCTVTVSGSLNQFQLENAAASTFPTSFIPTTGAAGSRSTDLVITKFNAASTPGWWVCSDIPIRYSSAQRCIGETQSGSLNSPLLQDGSSTGKTSIYDSGYLVTTTNAATLSAVNKSAMSYTSAATNVVLNNQTVASTASIFTPTATYRIGVDSSLTETSIKNGYIVRIIYGTASISNDSLKSMTQ